jgi:hypothetical protein
VAQMMSHQDGLPGFDTPEDPAIWFDRQAVLDRLCAQAPMWPPGTASGYHPITIGYLAGEVFRLADGRSMGTALREDFARTSTCGSACRRLSTTGSGQIRKPAAPPSLGRIDPIKTAAFISTRARPRAGAARPNGGRSRSPRPICTARRAIWPVSSASSPTAGFSRGRHDPVAGCSGRQLTRERIHGQDKVLPYVISWATGLMRNEGLNIFGTQPGHRRPLRLGRLLRLRRSDATVSGAYVMTRQSPHLIGDPRAQRLIDAFYDGSEPVARRGQPADDAGQDRQRRRRTTSPP